MSSSKAGLAVVSSLSPVKMEFAPAKNITDCSRGEKDMRPAESRTIDFGIRMRAVAMVRAIWKTSGAAPPCAYGV